MAGFTIDTFTGKLSKAGLASPNKFKVSFDVLPVEDENRMLDFMCETVDIAGRNVQTMTNIEYGFRREVAYNAPTFNPLSMTFICTGEFREKRILDKWNNMIVDTSKGSDVAYYNTYATAKLTVDALGPDGETTMHSVEYHEVYPKSVQSVQLNHSTQNATLRVTAEFQYAYWLTKETNNRTSSSDYRTSGGYETGRDG